MESVPSVSAAAWPWRQSLESSRSTAAGAGRAARAARAAGAIQTAVGLTVAALFYYWLQRRGMGRLVATIALLNGLIAMLSPLGVYPKVTRAVAVLGRWIGQAMTWLLMPVVFYGLFTAAGLMLRMVGKLRISRRPDRSLPTYWRDLPASTPSPDSYRHQF